MESWQQLTVTLFGSLNAIFFVVGLAKSRNKKGMQIAYPLVPIGIFVWADAVPIALFWVVSSVISVVLGDWTLFLLLFSVFWLVRSVGETIYYFNQQFSTVVRQPGKDLPGYKLFNDEYIIWFVYQVVTQLVTVVSIVSSVYLFSLWFT